ncbi:hypothetical protein [Paenibacillus stellifer]|uniref:hypothetical protein n=1 Tax=Paenibacillus stellifer TaxID=169760 RepID=UPI00068F417D|nr:hypothetical protein [Paenibacillus stellifer]
MLWIKSYQATDRDPKTRKLCRATGMDTPTAVGSLHMFWWWALDWAPNGDISQYEAIDIAEAVHFGGDPEVLLAALIDAGYVAKTMEGREIVDWHEIGGQIIEARKKDAQRKADARRKREEKKGNPQDVQRKSEGHPADIHETSSGVPPDVHSIDKDLDIEKDLDLQKDSKIHGHADQQPDPNQDQDPKSEPTADKPAAPDEPGEPEKPGKKGRKKPEYAPDSLYMRMAMHFKAQLDALAKAEGVETLIPRANMQSWADDMRKLVELDRQKDQQQIAAVMEWVVTDRFWRKNVLSAETFREKYSTLLIQMNESKRNPATNKGSGGGAGGKPKIEMAVDDGQTGAVSEEEFAEMMRLANEIKDRKAQEAGRK